MTTLALLAATLIAFYQPPAHADAPPPKLTAKLHAAHAALAPGDETDLLIELEISEPWHVYHPIILDTGFPTTIRFTGPPEVNVRDLEFPRPKLGELAGIEYLELSGRILVLGKLELSSDAPVGKSLRLSATVNALACIEQCVPVSAEAELILPVESESRPAEELRLFEQARKALPKPLAEAQYIEKGDITISADTLSVGQAAEIVARIPIQRGMHIMDRDPGSEFLIPARLLIEPRNGVRIASEKDQVWPAPKVINIEGFGQVREQSGALTIRVPVEIIDTQFPAGPVELRTLFQYQACTDQGQCYPPQWARGVVRFTADTENPPDERYALYTAVEGGWTEASAAADPSDGVAASGVVDRFVAGHFSIWLILLFAFLGGLILNAMPCVLPVISLKILSFVQQGGEDPGRVVRLGLVFCLGMLVWFWMFAGMSMAGQLPLQYPSVIIGIGAVLVVLALNLFGVFEITLPGSAAGKLDALTAREGYGGAFFKGFLATLLGTACTAPFLGTALVYAASQPAVIAFGVFSAAGIGMASPYLLLTANPRWLKYLPRPGQWMITFKQAAGFVLLGTCVWLLTIVASQLGASGVVWTVSFWSFLGLAAWLLGLVRPSWSPGSRIAAGTSAVAVSLFGAWFSYGVMYRPEVRANVSADPESILAHVEGKDWMQGIPWAPYAPGVAEELSRRGYTVYIDYTASWCVNCQVNKALVLETANIRRRMAELNVIPIVADFSNQDPVMYEEITRRGRNSVPLNLIFPAGRPEDEIILPPLLTPGEVLAALEKAGPSRAPAGITQRTP